jgi:predicted metal-dependent enzyme (double-stranded beta helix superfamily)
MSPAAPNDHMQNRIAGCTAAHGGGLKNAYSLVWRHLTMGTVMFDLDQFIADCRFALAQDASHRAIREVVARVVADPNAVLDGLGEPKRGGIDKLYHAGDLTILNVVWPPFMTIMPHNHQMWAIIGIYTGREDNIFWRRLADGPGSKVEAAGAKALCEKDAEPLGRNIIHSVTNPIPRLSAAIHVYGGDFFAAERSEWDPETLSEQRYDVAKNMRLFEKANAANAPG